MKINLTPELAEYVRRKMATGFYASASEVVREAVRLLVVSEEHHRLRESICVGLDSGPPAP